MYNTITKFRKEIFQFTALLTTLMVGFAGFIFLLYGHVEGSFRNVTSGLLTLFRMTIGMIKFRHDLELDVFGITVIISLYALAITMVYINMFSSALNFGITHIKDMIAKGQTSFNWQLNQHFWNRVSSLLLPCRASRKVESRKNVKDGIKTVSELRKKIDFQRKVETSVGHFISKLIERSVQDSKLEKDFFRQTLLPSQHFKGSNFIWSIRRETTLGVQYRFSTKCTDRDNAFILEFLHEKVDCGIDMECLQITEAINRGLIPYGHGTQPVSSLYIVHITNYRTDSCKVFVKVATSQLSSQTAFLITGSHEPTRWEQHTAQHVGDDANHVYLSAILPMCPQYVLAVTSDLWCGVQSVIHQEHVKKFNLTTKKMTITPGSKQQMFLSFPPNSVQKDTIVKTVMEQGVRFPTLHVLASRDVKGPIIVEYVGKERTDELSSEHFMEIQLLTKTGDLEWRQESTWAPNNDRDNTVELDSLKAGVKMAVTIRLSDYIVSSAKITNRYLERERGTLLGIYKKNIPTKHWKQVGRSLGVPQHKLAKIENTKPRSLEEKACLVLRYWLRENHGRGLQDIQNIWKQRVV
ncbi:uncharacterized protein LOC132548013 [Ylistrum balloti]|uniref:uncharacterized protein LOC132548013 n=1 Tax=Ylistrum balloti TaxID=509963 RepID=UPI002905CA65|nr:uncharacterized protein LOC132548013 [Ylistrum balloti]